MSLWPEVLQSSSSIDSSKVEVGAGEYCRARVPRDDYVSRLSEEESKGLAQGWRSNVEKQWKVRGRQVQ